jgi:hypothetical protein
MLGEMAGKSTAPDLEETMREPLALTCYLPVAEVPAYDAADGATSFVKERPQRVTVTPVRVKQKRQEPERAIIAPRPAAGAPVWRPARARPAPARRIPAQPPKRKVSPRANTVPSLAPERFDLSSLAMFWGVALAGSLVAIGIALTAW